MLLTKPDTLALDVCELFYLSYCRAKGQSESTLQSKSDALRLFREWALQNRIIGIDDINVNVLDSYQYSLNEHRKRSDGMPLARGTIRYRLTTVKVMMRVLCLKNVIAENPCERFELPKLGRKLPNPVLSEEEVQSVLEQASFYGTAGIRDRAIMETYYASGLRRQELRNLMLGDIDFVQLQLRVAQGKGHKDRYVPISQRACAWIYRYLKEIRVRYASIHSGKTLFLANNGKPFRVAQLSELVAKYIKLSEVRKAGACNQYRHAAATHMVDNGADIRHVQEFLGHADLSTTQVYVHVSMEKLREVYNRTHPAAKHD
ncbi:integrase [Aestuariibacter sp. GS-14]|uniref:tyrosine-type recombinase/integrase n=1 Tax=Aestuariibacter sp. GS-14 TaxID=2590670 RepID=UPI00112AA322|nr:tyrosine-type recombinase/integrase [Aestuariibacter sp. GS-14]TPV56937.1 integrase [Aestuariibacter sp. GS-14]